MSYHIAHKCFRENRDLVSPPGQDIPRMVAFNLAQGLDALTQATENDLHAIENRLAHVESLLSRLVQKQ